MSQGALTLEPPETCLQLQGAVNKGAKYGEFCEASLLQSTMKNKFGEI